MKKQTIISLCLLLCLATQAWSQTDTEFWFAAPYLSNVHDNSQDPDNGKLCLTSYDNAAHVTVSMPASNYSRQYTLQPNTSIDLQIGGNELQRAKPGQITFYGIHIESDEKISAYYAQVNQNSEIYTLKGRNALGTDFLVPMQNLYGCAHEGKACIEIVATEDNTTVTFTCPVDYKAGSYMKYDAGTTNKQNMNKGQIICLQAYTSDASGHLGGTTIKSNKPIAVNTTDDSVDGGWGQDLVGEQIVPTNLAGNDYIAIKNNGQIEQLILYPLPGAIYYSINGDQQPFNGQTAYIDLTQGTYAGLESFALRGHMIVFQLTSIGRELGGTVLPTLTGACTGSDEVVIKKRFSGQTLMLLTKSGNESGFTLNGVAINAAFTPINNMLQDNWVYTKINNVNWDANDIVRIKNDNGFFHAALIDGDNDGTCTYGYFTDYNQMEVTIKDVNTSYKVGEAITLSIENDGDYDNATWTYPDGSKHSGKQLTIIVESKDKNEGTYSVTANSHGCKATSSVTITIEDNDDPTLPPTPPDEKLVVELKTKQLTICHGEQNSIVLEWDVVSGQANALELIGNGYVKQVLSEGQTSISYNVAQLTPDVHNIDLRFSNDKNEQTPVMTCQLTVLYDPEQVFAQKWNNVLAIYNAPYATEQGYYGHEWSAYQWYKNGQPIAGANGSYYHIADGEFEEGDTYQAELTRLEDGVTLMTCEYHPNIPTQAAPEEKHIYNRMGQEVRDTNAPGIYIIVNGSETYKMLVL